MAFNIDLQCVNGFLLDSWFVTRPSILSGNSCRAPPSSVLTWTSRAAPLSFALRSVPTCCVLLGKYFERSNGTDKSCVGSAVPPSSA
eukprot:12407409-Karenia_brevis.AAC.1